MNELDTRSRLLGAMADALQIRGLHGVGLSAILERADAPKGVLYHHFPGGKRELAVAAIEYSRDRVLASLDALVLAAPDPLAGLDAWVQATARRLAASGYERGCPLATVALESTGADADLRNALREAFDAVRVRLAQALQRMGADDAQAARGALVLVSVFEGALIQARVAADADVLRTAAAGVLEMIRRDLARARP